MSGRGGSLARAAAAIVLIACMAASLTALDGLAQREERQDRMYFPSGRMLVESSLGFREMAADYLWFRFIQYFGAYAKGQHDLRYFDLLVDAITRLDPRFVEAYHFASLVQWSELGDLPGAIDMLKRGVLHNPDSAKLHFMVGFNHYVFEQQNELAAKWFEAAARCSDGGDRERRFAAFARYRAGDDNVSLALWQEMYKSTESPQMRELAETMIRKLKRRLAGVADYGADFIGPIPE